MTSPDRVLIDTSAFYALINPEDDHHESSLLIYSRLVTDSTELWVTSYVLVEFGALTHSRLGFQALRTFAESTSRMYRILWIDQAIHDEAWEQMLSKNGQGLNFVDWTVLVASRRLDATIFTFDRRFRLEGATVVPLR